MWNVLVVTGAILDVKFLFYWCMVQGVQLRSYSCNLFHTFECNQPHPNFLEGASILEILKQLLVAFFAISWLPMWWHSSYSQVVGWIRVLSTCVSGVQEKKKKGRILMVVLRFHNCTPVPFAFCILLYACRLCPIHFVWKSNNNKIIVIWSYHKFFSNSDLIKYKNQMITHL